MRGFFRFLFYDYKSKWGNLITIVIFIALPIVMSLLMTVVFGRGNKEASFEPPKIALVNKDDGFLSKGFVKFLTNDEMKKEFNFVLTDYEKGYKGMKDQDYSAILIIPEKFTDDFLEEKSPEVILIKNPSQGIYPEMVETMLSLMTEGTNYLLTYYYPQFKEASEIYKSIKNQTILPKLIFLDFGKLKDLGKDFFKKSKNLIDVVKNQSFEVKFEKRVKEKKSKRFIDSLFPGYALFFLLFFANIVAVSIVKERGMGISKRVLLTDFSVNKYLLAKVVSGVFFLFSLSIVFVLSGYFIFHIKTDMFFLLFFIIFLSCFSLFSVFFLTSSLAKNEASASNLGMVVLFLMGFTGGGMIPLNLIPQFLISFSKFLPFYRLNMLFADLFNKSSFNLDNALYSLFFSLVAYSLGFIFFRKKLISGEL
ncbi:antibiotic transport system permease protein [Thermotomaculum hydrothermale]|uniref:Antibiotic transport system permease protein n=1 Tax=Thermotomaculum hydrothermale TaxID=981385 RepID=A0A7R6SXM9_9BACT|nr:ABC transporter permease [Thermotomaculum hydrothermale]BBB31720.1 antibiotic transport system permease protein [Thermotomaculum hydrothermale]